MKKITLLTLGFLIIQCAQAMDEPRGEYEIIECSDKQLDKQVDQFCSFIEEFIANNVPAWENDQFNVNCYRFSIAGFCSLFTLALYEMLHPASLYHQTLNSAITTDENWHNFIYFISGFPPAFLLQNIPSIALNQIGHWFREHAPKYARIILDKEELSIKQERIKLSAQELLNHKHLKKVLTPTLKEMLVQRAHSLGHLPLLRALVDEHHVKLLEDIEGICPFCQCSWNEWQSYYGPIVQYLCSQGCRAYLHKNCQEQMPVCPQCRNKHGRIQDVFELVKKKSL